MIYIDLHRYSNISINILMEISINLNIDLSEALYRQRQQSRWWKKKKNKGRKRALWWEQRCYEREMAEKQPRQKEAFPPEPPKGLPTSSEDLWFGVPPPPPGSFQEAARKTCIELGIGPHPDAGSFWFVNVDVCVYTYLNT